MIVREVYLVNEDYKLAAVITKDPSCKLDLGLLDHVSRNGMWQTGRFSTLTMDPKIEG